MPGNDRLRNPNRWLLPSLALIAAGGAGYLVGVSMPARAPAAPLLPLIASGRTIVDEPIVYPSAAPAKITAAVVALQPGEETGWHTHGVPAFGYLLEGELTVEYGDKGTRTYRAGDAVLEAIAAPHNGRNTGNGPMRILAVFMGAEGLPTTLKAEPPK